MSLVLQGGLNAPEPDIGGHVRCPKKRWVTPFLTGVSNGKRSVTGVVVVHRRPKLADDDTDVGGTRRQMLPLSNAVKELDGIPCILVGMVVCTSNSPYSTNKAVHGAPIPHYHKHHASLQLYIKSLPLCITRRASRGVWSPAAYRYTNWRWRDFMGCNGRHEVDRYDCPGCKLPITLKRCGSARGK